MRKFVVGLCCLALTILAVSTAAYAEWDPPWNPWGPRRHIEQTEYFVINIINTCRYQVPLNVDTDSQGVIIQGLNPGDEYYVREPKPNKVHLYWPDPFGNAPHNQFLGLNHTVRCTELSGGRFWVTVN